MLLVAVAVATPTRRFFGQNAPDGAPRVSSSDGLVGIGPCPMLPPRTTVIFHNEKTALAYTGGTDSPYMVITLAMADMVALDRDGMVHVDAYRGNDPASGREGYVLRRDAESPEMTLVRRVPETPSGYAVSIETDELRTFASWGGPGRVRGAPAES